jgi:thiamine biosynthesis lipoprotein
MIRAQPLLGTLVEIKIHDSISADTTQHAINTAFECIQLVQKLMSFHDPDSELSRINREAFQRPIQVHAWVYAVLKRANLIFQHSDGLFDCSVADQLVNWQLLPDHFVSKLKKTDLNTARLNTYLPYSQAHLVLLTQNHVKLTAPILLDLGGIAKGFAVDLAIHCLKQHGIQNAVVNAGGDLRVLGEHPEPISLRDPTHPQHFHHLGNLSNGAIASSARYFSQKQLNQTWVNALVHPQTRKPLDSAHSFSVIAPNACIADALTKVVAISQNPEHPCLKMFAAQALII